MKKISFNSIRKSLTFWKTGEQHSLTDRAERDWRIMLVIFSVLILIVIGFGIYQFFDINNKSFNLNQDEQNIANVTVDTEKLDGILQNMRNKTNMLEEVLSQEPQTEDPSL